MKKICKNYVPVDRNYVQRRVVRLGELGHFLKNRSPTLDEIKACTPYLDEQINLIQPKIIIPLGNFATSYIFEKYNLKHDKISDTHGRIFQINTLFGSVKIIPMFHPAVATYNQDTKSVLLKDFKAIKEVL
jgi:DNA polymerase